MTSEHSINGRSGLTNGRAGQQETSSESGRKKLSPADFMFGVTLGEGAYARVVHAKRKGTNAEFAVKIIEQRFIRKENKVKFVMMEKNVLSMITHPLVIKLHYTFRDRSYLYFVMELCRGGELLDVIMKYRDIQSRAGIPDSACSITVTKFFIAEVVLALRFLHSRGIIHRDLKPENILLTDKGHIKLADFGTAKIEKDGRSNTFVGTAEYVSPEVLKDGEVGKACDLWAVGCMIYQMLVGRPLFRGESEYLTFQMILEHPAAGFTYPTTIPPEAQDLISRLLVQDAASRLGAGNNDGNDYPALMAHPFFEGIQWDKLLQAESPYQPRLKPLPEPNADGARDDWMYAGLATELIDDRGSLSPRQMLEEGVPNRSPHRRPVPVQRQWQDAEHLPSDPQVQRLFLPQQQQDFPANGLSGNGLSGQSSDSVWNQFLLPNECILFSNLVSKRRGLFSKKRQLLLTSTPRLVYIDPQTMKKKGEVPWSPSLHVQMKNQHTFDICTPTRNYHFSDTDYGAHGWDAAIRRVQQQLQQQ